jgi:hypothetical protein
LNPDDLDGKAEAKRPRTGAAAAMEESHALSGIRSLVDMEHPIPKTEFIRRIQLAHDISRTRARELFEEALEAGYLKCGHVEGAERANNAVKLVLLGDVDPAAKSESESDEEDEYWRR